MFSFLRALSQARRLLLSKAEFTIYFNSGVECEESSRRQW